MVRSPGIDKPVPSAAPDPDNAEDADERRQPAELFRDLRTSRQGLATKEADRRQLVYGPNELTRRGGPRWPGELLAQFTQPLAILLALAAVLAWLGGTPALSIAVVAVILLNAGFAFVQEMQAERAVEALAACLPATARVVRGGTRCEIAARDLVPGDILIVAEGDRVCADARIVDGTVQLDLSALTGESLPVSRSCDPGTVTGPLARNPHRAAVDRGYVRREGRVTRNRHGPGRRDQHRWGCADHSRRARGKDRGQTPLGVPLRRIRPLRPAAGERPGRRDHGRLQGRRTHSERPGRRAEDRDTQHQGATRRRVRTP